jgi:excisionase family DNA binding protein
MNTTNAKFCRVPDIAAALGVTPALVYKLIKRGKIPAIRVGVAVRVPREAVRRLYREGIGNAK